MIRGEERHGIRRRVDQIFDVWHGEISRPLAFNPVRRAGDVPLVHAGEPGRLLAMTAGRPRSRSVAVSRRVSELP